MNMPDGLADELAPFVDDYGTTILDSRDMKDIRKFNKQPLQATQDLLRSAQPVQWDLEPMLHKDGGEPLQAAITEVESALQVPGEGSQVNDGGEQLVQSESGLG
jgi:hypothetical protein